MVQRFDFLLHPLQSRSRLRAALQQYDPFQNVVSIINAHLSEPHPLADVDFCNVLDVDRRPGFLSDDDVFNVVQIFDETHASHVEALFAQREIVTPHVGIAVAERVQHLSERHVVLNQAAGVDFDMILLGGSTVGRHINDSPDLLKLSLQFPVLDRLQVAERHAGRAHQFIPIDLGDGRPRRELRLGRHRQRDKLKAV